MTGHFIYFHNTMSPVYLLHAPSCSCQTSQTQIPVIHSEMCMCLSLCQACGHVSSPEKYLEAKYGHSHFYNSWTMGKKSCTADSLNNLMSHLIEMSMEGCNSRIPGHMCRGVRMVSDTSMLTFHCRIFNDYFAVLKLFRLFWMDLNEHTKPVLWSQPEAQQLNRNFLKTIS